MDVLAGADVLRWLAACVTLAILLGGFAFLLNRYKHQIQGRASAGAQGHKRLKVIDSLALSPRQRLFLIEDGVHEHLILIGPTESTAIHTHQKDENNA